MNNLQAIRRRAQSQADRESRPLAILNLNRFSPLYVIRAADPGIETARGFVEIVRPQAVAGE